MYLWGIFLVPFRYFFFLVLLFYLCCLRRLLASEFMRGPIFGLAFLGAILDYVASGTREEFLWAHVFTLRTYLASASEKFLLHNTADCFQQLKKINTLDSIVIIQLMYLLLAVVKHYRFHIIVCYRQEFISCSSIFACTTKSKLSHNCKGKGYIGAVNTLSTDQL